MKNKRMISNLLLLLTAFIWGIAFVAQSAGMEHVGPWTFVFFRYMLSSLVLAPVSFLAQKHIGKQLPADEKKEMAGTSRISQYFKGGLLCGVFLGFASICQQAGLLYTTAGKAGFITALYVVLVPVFGLLIKKKPEKKIWLCVALGLAGLYLISVKDGFAIAAGDALVMLCAVLFTGQIMSIDHFSSRVENAVLLSNVQFITAALIGGAGMLIFERPVMENILAAALPVLYAGVMSGAVGYTLQIVAQRNTDPAVASLLMSLESVFSALAGWVILGQGLSLRELSGCALVMAAVILAQIPLTGILMRKKQKNP